MSEIDFGRHSGDYARYRPGFPDFFYDRLETLAPLENAIAADLATGPGVIALELARRGSRVTGIDVAPDQVAAARKLAAEQELSDRAEFMEGKAEDTGLEGGAFDLIAAGQCWHWFDGPAALEEARRLLRPGGLLVIAYYSYLARHSSLARETEELVHRYNPDWSMSGFSGQYPALVDGVIEGGFDLDEQFCYDHEEAFTHEAWRGRMRTCNGVGSGGLSPGEVRSFDADLARHLSENHPEPVAVPHRVWCVAGRKPG
ncbi:MAG: methyltransferase domain-containing protein [Balneolaceae bacterium]|nr:methyltransferase domain-containing protein [Balneolaceae bacterium]